jgi:HSP20 family protein
MTLTKREAARVWDPFREMEDMTARLNRLFTRPFGTMEGAGRGYDWAPSMNISETPKSYVVSAELPGVKKEDVRVTVESGVLTIAGERRQELEEKNERLHRVESQYGSFMRRVSIPEDASQDEIEASYRDGMLVVKVAKLTPEERTTNREIPIS